MSTQAPQEPIVITTKVPATAEKELTPDEIMQGEGHRRALDREYERLKNDLRVRQGQKAAVEIHRNLFWSVLATYAILVVLVLFFCSLAILFGAHRDFFGVPIRYPAIVFVVFTLAHISSSFGSVRVDEKGGLTCFGRPVWTINHAGLAFPIYGIFKLHKEPWTEYADVYPANKLEHIKHFKGPTRNKDGTEEPPEIEKYDVEKGEVRPIFAPTGSPTMKELETLKKLIKSGMPEESAVLFRQLTVELSFSVLWRIGDLFAYERVIPGDTPDEKREEVRSRLMNFGITELKETIRTMTPATVLQCQEMIGRRLAIRLQLIALDWGIDIRRAVFLEQNLGHDTNARQAAAVRAAFIKIETIRKAEAEEARLTREGYGRGAAFKGEGAGKAAAAQAMLEAEATGLLKIATNLQIPDRQMIFIAKMAEAMAGKANFAMFGGQQSLSDIMAMISAGKSMPALDRPVKVIESTQTKPPEQPGQSETKPDQGKESPKTSHKLPGSPTDRHRGQKRPGGKDRH